MKQLLAPQEHRPPAFLQSLSVGSQIAQSLEKERQSTARGQEVFLSQSLAQQRYVDDAIKARSGAPDEALQIHQELHSTLQQQMTYTVRASDETDHANRLASQNVFLENRQRRHEDVLVAYEQEKSNITDACEKAYAEKTSDFQQWCADCDQLCTDILAPVETVTGNLGERSQSFVQNLIDQLMNEVAKRKDMVVDYCEMLKAVEAERSARFFELLEHNCTTLTDVAHLLPGEIERWAAAEVASLNLVLVDNGNAITKMYGKLCEQTCGKRKEMRSRWQYGLLLWKKMRHHHALLIVIERIESREFQHPLALEHVLEQLRQKQMSVFLERRRLVQELYAIPVEDLKSSHLANVEEQNNVLNDRTQEEYDNLFVEMKALKDTTHHKGDSMLNQLRTELELYDAKSEWKDHDSVKSYVVTEVTPKLDKVFVFVDALFDQIAVALQTWDDNQHHCGSKLITFGVKVTNALEKFKQRTHEFEFHHANEVEGCLEEFEDQCAEYEKQMDQLHLKMNDAAHQKDLDEILSAIFEHLEVVGLSYRTHADALLTIHRRYPQQITDYFSTETDAFAPLLCIRRQVEKQDEDDQGEEQEQPVVMYEEVPEFPFPLIQEMTVDEFRKQVVPPNVPEVDEGEEEAEEKPAEEEEVIPVCADGTQSLHDLQFHPRNIDLCICDLRLRTIDSLRIHHERVSTKARETLELEEENISTLLNQRLRRHGNRRGNVQVEWYIPSKSVIEKHKIKFERHLIQVATKNMTHEDTFDEILESVNTKREEYTVRREQFREKVKSASSLIELSACERRARKDALGVFQEEMQKILEQLHHLATKAPADLQAQNKAFLQLCRANAVEDGTAALDTSVDMYSVSEMEFYSGEVDILNQKLQEKAQLRLEKHDELQEQKDGYANEPFQEFLQFFEETMKDVVANQGLGLLGRKK
eukprot:GEMP01009583.1.p1 GENE.GEMP01009583.1~~GEMP01009583.1.p1  ORF type:complete len:929 (+),score=263.92 GEMP01009583.1:148-2934(+)